MKKKYKKNKFSFRLSIVCCFLVCLLFCVSTYFITYSEFVSRFAETNSDNSITSIKDNAVVIDDLEKDYYYYTGQNYTDSDGTLPTSVNKNIYSDNNLVQVKITYSSEDINNDNKAYVSISELQDTYIYYKVFPVNDNNTSDLSDDYILIELIDNPFTNRDEDKGFNGWVTSYENATISYDDTYYLRYAKVPVTYTNNTLDTIDITFNASWLTANVSYLANSSWDSAFASLNNKEMQKTGLITYKYTYGDVDMSGYYHQVNIGFFRSCKGYYDSEGRRQNNCTCYTYGGCTYYQLINNENFDEGQNYYEIVNGNMTLVDNSTIDRPIISVDEIINNNLDSNANMAGYYEKFSVANNTTMNNYYDFYGVYHESGVCNNTKGCDYYKLIQYYDESGNASIYDENKEYYYLATRDTNIIVMNANNSSAWSSSNTKPFTLTSLHNNVDYRNNVTWTVNTGTNWNSDGISVNCYNDTVIENLKISYGANMSTTETSPTSTTNTNGVLYARFNNVKIGRGIIRNGNYANFASVLGGSNSASGSTSNTTKYRLIVESGFYSTMSLTNGQISSTTASYIEAQGIYGNDYDRASKNNNNLIVNYAASGSWGGVYYTTSPTAIGFDLTVKSGQYGANKYDAFAGIYAGGRGNSNGKHYTARRVKHEGGYTYNLIGGPITGSNRANYNDTYLYITGGEIDMVFGGAGQSATYGNRIIQATGGKINYSIFGGSNGNAGRSGDGTVNGSSYIYVGGTAIIGNSDYVNDNNSLYGAEAGSVFGIGNGNSSYETIGSSDNSIIIINEEAQIYKNVYGGGNYAAVGISSTSSTTTSDLQILGGTIYGNVYGGGNRNGTGSSRKPATVNIKITDGNVIGSIYGGANIKGTIYGNVNIKANGGTIDGSIYGGGLGGYTNDTDSGTFVANNINIEIGDNNEETSATIKQNIYGGSSYGSVNGTVYNGSTSNYKTNVVVNKGTILGSVFGGGQGSDTYTPYVYGDILVTINNGNINNVFGGCDQAGSPSGNVKVIVNNGDVTNVFGGGNKTSLTTSNVEINGGTITSVFGGSNELGDVTTSNVIVNGGTISSVYGSNNVGGKTITSNVLLNNGNITSSYGGGKLAITDDTNITLNGAVTTDLFGGGESADITNNTNVYIKNGTATSVYGGSNIIGNVPTTNIIANGGTATYVYGANNAGGLTNTTNINVDGTSINSVYGGGNEADATTSNVIINNSSSFIENVFGGGNKSSVTTSNVDINGASIGSVFGGSNELGQVENSNVRINEKNNNSSNLAYDVSYVANDTESWQTTEYKTVVDVTVNITNNSAYTIDKYNGFIKIDDSILNNNYSNTDLTVNNGLYYFNEANKYYGINSISPSNTYTFTFSVFTNQDKDNINLSYSIIASDNNSNTYSDGSIANIKNVYGSNNAGGKTINAYVVAQDGIIDYLYGGGNEAITNNTKVQTYENATINYIYGGGNKAEVETNTDVYVEKTNVKKDIFGGGNAAVVKGNTKLYVSGASVGNSIYAGGNGTSAVVNGSTLLNIDNNATINKHVFGGGNAAATGDSSSNEANSILNIAGATILGNVYGGANTSVVYGVTNVNIGTNVVSDNNLIKSDINIVGTVFGGGEANASGSEIYDYSFISVTKGININIDGENHDNFNMSGSIFGSGNASSTQGFSYINISNYGNLDNCHKNISIQRSDRVVISNSCIELEGATDRTNEYSDVLFSFSRIKELKIKNNTSLFLQTGSNLLEKFISAYDDNGEEKLATVNIDSDSKTVNRSVDNRLYMLEGKNLNIATNEKVTAYGEVEGMTFFGMYAHDRNGEIYTALYSNDYDYGYQISGSDLYYFTSGSYVLGLHKTNHDIEKDGFYSNFGSEEVENTIEVRYINPIPEDSNYYMWVIGEQIASYEVDLSASKYLTLGTSELSMLNNYAPNSTFSIVGFNYDNLNSDISLVDEYDIPRIADTTDEADKTMSLVMKSGTNGWITKGKTSFLTNKDNQISGTIDYLRENTSTVPSFILYLYHSKNIATNGDMGTVTISMLVSTPVDDLNNEVERVNIIVNLSRALYNTSEYEATITPGKEYSMFATSDVNITSKGSFSAYYSLYMPSETNPYKNGDHRSLVSSYAFSENTKITLIDLVGNGVNDYYYYVINAQDVIDAENELAQQGEVSYDFSKFVKMGSTDNNNKYSDSSNNLIYYDATKKSAHEEFIVIVDFSEANIDSNLLGNSLLVELRNSDNQTIINVLGASQSSMFYDVYYGMDATISVDAALDKNYVYPGSSINLDINTNFVEQTIDNVDIFDTTYEDQKLGIKITIYDSDGNQVTGASLFGVSFTYKNNNYYPRMDGTTRINISPTVANVYSKIKINTTSSLAPGNYQMKIESFGSADGIYYGLVASDSTTIDFSVLNNVYGLSVDMNDKMMIIDKETGNTLMDNNTIVYNLNYDSNLNDPIIRISLYRRNYDSINDLNYTKVDLLDYVTNSYTQLSDKEYLLTDAPSSNTDLFMQLKDNLTTGTYRLTFSIYDGSNYIGQVYKYLIIK